MDYAKLGTPHRQCPPALGGAPSAGAGTVSRIWSGVQGCTTACRRACCAVSSSTWRGKAPRKPWGNVFEPALTELGPTFIKLGQILSTRPDMIGAEMAGELSLLQDRVLPRSFADMAAVAEAELGGTIGELFLEFDPEARGLGLTEPGLPGRAFMTAVRWR